MRNCDRVSVWNKFFVVWSNLGIFLGEKKHENFYVRIDGQRTYIGNGEYVRLL
jgi:hypothetical protein